jgi:hypothetical protein
LYCDGINLHHPLPLDVYIISQLSDLVPMSFKTSIAQRRDKTSIARTVGYDGENATTVDRLPDIAAAAKGGEIAGMVRLAVNPDPAARIHPQC